MTYRADIATLIKKHIDNELTVEEQNILNIWLNQSNDNRLVFSELTNVYSLREALQEFYDFSLTHVGEKPVAVVRMHPSKTNWIKYFLAAAVVIMAVCLVWLFAIKNRNGKLVAGTDTAIKKITSDIPPGSNKAVLTLANGSTIELDNAHNGIIAEQGKTVINKKNGELVYSEGKVKAKNDIISWNTITTPRGGQYVLSLPDGSRVWLNAASSLKFPVTFSGNKRVVELKGEAYFDVVHNESMPFEVQLSNGTKVEVLGTKFNIMAYNEEAELRTTLVLGKVKMVNGQKQEIELEPGNQAQLAGNGKLTIQKDADVATAVAWKEGLFKFSHTDIRAVMRSLARWYDVQIVYDRNLPEKYFSGEISRRLNAVEVLSVIEFAGVHFRIDGRKISVLP